MSDIRRPYNYGIRGIETGTFIQCINDRETQIHELWCWDIDGIFREVHPKSHVEIPDETVGEFVTEYLSENGRRNHIIGELLINRGVQFIGLSQIWGSRLL